MQPVQAQHSDSSTPQLSTWQRPSRRERPADPGDELCVDLISEEAKCLECDLTAARGMAILAAAGLSSAPVVDDNGVLVGMVFATRLASFLRVEDVTDVEVEVEDAMMTEVVTAPSHATVAEVAKLMARHNLDRIPVVTHDGRLVGVICAMDLVRWLSDRLP